MVTVLTALVIGLALLAGDQRELKVVLASPGDGEAIGGGQLAVALTFNRAPDRQAVADRIQIEPEAAGTVRWRGTTIEYVFAWPPAPDRYRLVIPKGAIGTRGEQLRADYVLEFTVREPGVAYVAPGGEGERLVARFGQEPARDLLTGTRIRDFGVAPDGRTVAAVVERSGRVVLDFVDVATGARRTLAEPTDFELASVTWGPDNQTLLTVRRDRLPGGGFGVPRLWLVRLSGEFAGLIGEDGEPVAGGAWSPDGQRIAYAAPATAETAIRTLATGETVRYARSRGRTPVWSPDGAWLAYEGVDRDFREGASPLQPVVLQPLDGSPLRLVGVPGEVRAAPRFLDAATLLSLRRAVGAATKGTELVFESVATGREVRALDLAAGQDLVLDWELAPGGRAAVYAVRSGRTSVVLRVDFETGQRTVVAQDGDRPKWLP
ncbi:MAG: TolB family protein [Dehalococcoidia bacterium]